METSSYFPNRFNTTNVDILFNSHLLLLSSSQNILVFGNYENCVSLKYCKVLISWLGCRGCVSGSGGLFSEVRELCKCTGQIRVIHLIWFALHIHNTSQCLLWLSWSLFIRQYPRKPCVYVWNRNDTLYRYSSPLSGMGCQRSNREPWESEQMLSSLMALSII